jgi:hypothetical protein
MVVRRYTKRARALLAVLMLAPLSAMAAEPLTGTVYGREWITGKVALNETGAIDIFSTAGDDGPRLTVNLPALAEGAGVCSVLFYRPPGTNATALADYAIRQGEKGALVLNIVNAATRTGQQVYGEVEIPAALLASWKIKDRPLAGKVQSIGQSKATAWKALKVVRGPHGFPAILAEDTPIEKATQPVISLWKPLAEGTGTISYTGGQPLHLVFEGLPHATQWRGIYKITRHPEGDGFMVSLHAGERRPDGSLISEVNGKIHVPAAALTDR